MLNHLTRPSNKKFYNKWKYKITLKVEGAAALRSYNRTRLKNIIVNGEDFDTYGWFCKSTINRTLFLNLVSCIEKHQLTIRVERDCIDLYTNDKDVYDEISLEFLNHIKHRYELVQGAVEEKEEERVIFVKKYPHDKYQYKVFLAPHNSTTDDKVAWVQWTLSQGDRIRISNTVKTWFIATKWNWDRRYMYVEDEATLLMVKMRSSTALGKVYQYRLIDK